MNNCEKINLIGETLESNLNDRGVECTFGKGAGESTIYDMTCLVTANNLRGSADAALSIVASRPYLLSGESTDIIVKLSNGLGVPLGNKSVTISDGSSSYSGITNSLGLFVLYDISVSADTTFTATYDSTINASCTVEYCEFIDYGVTNKSNLSNLYYEGVTTVATVGTLFECNSNNRWSIRPNSFGLFNTGFEIDFTVVSTSGRFAVHGFNSSTTQVFSIDTNNNIRAGDDIRITITDTTLTFYRNGVQLGTTRTYTSVDKLKIQIYFNQANTYLQYKNFRIKAL